jgi:hypothetical protein
MKTYILTFERNSYSDYADLQKGIATNPKISDWWHYITNAYLIKSDLNSVQLSEEIKQYMPYDNRHVVLEVNGWGAGLLPKEAWDWINTNVPR